METGVRVLTLNGAVTMDGVVHVISGSLIARSSTLDQRFAAGDTFLLERLARVEGAAARLLILDPGGGPAETTGAIARRDPELIETADRILTLTGSRSSLKSHVLETAAAYFVSLFWMKVSDPELAAGCEHDCVELGRRMIRTHASTAMPLKELLARIPYSYEHFSRLFKARHGQTPHEYRERQRLARAQRLLAEDGLSITRLAYALGYSSSQHFATNFKKQIGITPREYRAAVGVGL